MSYLAFNKNCQQDQFQQIQFTVVLIIVLQITARVVTLKTRKHYHRGGKKCPALRRFLPDYLYFIMISFIALEKKTAYHHVKVPLVVKIVS